MILSGIYCILYQKRKFCFEMTCYVSSELINLIAAQVLNSAIDSTLENSCVWNWIKGTNCLIRDWLNCATNAPMLSFRRGTPNFIDHVHGRNEKIRRRLNLFAVCEIEHEASVDTLRERHHRNPRRVKCAPFFFFFFRWEARVDWHYEKRYNVNDSG